MADAIETSYKGRRFRSRLEARWAVLFDARGIQWQYELEGFKTPAGPYLPDFYLPQVSMWAEVKPDTGFDSLAANKALSVATQTDKEILLLDGEPRNVYWLGLMPVVAEGLYAKADTWSVRAQWYDLTHRRRYHEEEHRFYCEGSVYELLAGAGRHPRMFRLDLRDWIPTERSIAGDILGDDAAVETALSARFEHGESGPSSGWGKGRRPWR